MSLALIARIEALERRLAELEAKDAVKERRLYFLEQGIIRDEDDPFPVDRLKMPKALKRLLQREDAP